MESTFSKVALCCPGTLIAFDFATNYWQDRSNSTVNLSVDYLTYIGEPWLFGIDPTSSPTDIFGPLGFSLEVWLGPCTFQDKYIGSNGLSNNHNLVMNLGIMSVK